jgi:hypothetical protein
MDVTRADPDLAKGHSLLQQRLPPWEQAAAGAGFRVQRLEVYRPDARQAWLYGQGRTPEALQAVGLDPALARPGQIVTNAWSAKTSAHGYTIQPNETPAAAGADYGVLDSAGKLWAADADWPGFMVWCLANEQQYAIRHFGPPLHPVTDQPHVQLVEYNDHTHQLDRLVAGGA